MEKDNKYYTPPTAMERVRLSWTEDIFRYWKPKHIEPEEWTKYFFRLRILRDFIHYSHRKNKALIFKVYVDDDTQETKEREWKKFCAVTLYEYMESGFKEKFLIQKYGDTMGKKEISEFVRLVEGKKRTKGTVFYG